MIIGLALAGSHHAVCLGQVAKLENDGNEAAVSVEAEIARLEQIFVSTEPSAFRVVHTSAELPAKSLEILSRWFPRGLAEWGEPWNSGDVIDDDQPTGQHVVSWVSGSTTLVVLNRGGITGQHPDLLLTDTTMPIYCHYRLRPTSVPSTPSIDSMQNLFRPGRARDDSKLQCFDARYVSSGRIAR